MTERDVVLAFHGGKLRSAVLLQIRGDQALVIFMTGTERTHYPHVKVEHGEAYGKALQLEKDSFFYRSGVVATRVEKLQRGRGRCPPGLFFKLADLIREAMAQ